MKIPIWITALIVAAIAVPGWYGQRRISALRLDRKDLAARSAAAGLSIAPNHPHVIARLTKRPRPDRTAAVRQLAADLVADFPKSEMDISSRNEAARRSMADQMDRVLSLGKDQLILLIAELRTGWNPEDDADRGKLILFAVTRLSEHAPREALDLLTDSPEMQQLDRRNMSFIKAEPMFAAVGTWAETDPAAALEWVRAHPEFSSRCELALVFGAVRRDTDTALALIRGFGKQPKEVADAFAAWAEPEQRLDFLTVLRQWQAQAVEGELPEKCFDSSIRQLALGNSGQRSTFEFSTGWIEDAKLSPGEIETLTQGIDGQMKPGEEDKWMGWLAANLPEETALNRISEIVESWTNKDPVVAAAWIANAPAGSVKNTAERSYAETIFPYQPAEAIRRTLALPDDEDRKWTLRKFHREWPENDPAGKAAFAKEHGIE